MSDWSCSEQRLFNLNRASASAHSSKIKHSGIIRTSFCPSYITGVLEIDNLPGGLELTPQAPFNAAASITQGTTGSAKARKS